jgi:hypothetical protein
MIHSKLGFLSGRQNNQDSKADDIETSGRVFL